MYVYACLYNDDDNDYDAKNEDVNENNVDKMTRVMRMTIMVRIMIMNYNANTIWQIIQTIYNKNE